MARRDWNKLARQSQAQKDIHNDWLQSRYDDIVRSVKNELVWPIGKHKGKLIGKLSIHYLCWASENLSGKAKQLADRELRQRYQHIRLAGQK